MRILASVYFVRSRRRNAPKSNAGKRSGTRLFSPCLSDTTRAHRTCAMIARGWGVDKTKADAGGAEGAMKGGEGGGSENACFSHKTACRYFDVQKFVRVRETAGVRFCVLTTQNAKRFTCTKICCPTKLIRHVCYFSEPSPNAFYFRILFKICPYYPFCSAWN